jgi:hypothetical protein
MGYIGLPVLKTGWATGPLPPQGAQSMAPGVPRRVNRAPTCRPADRDARLLRLCVDLHAVLGTAADAVAGLIDPQPQLGSVLLGN